MKCICINAGFYNTKIKCSDVGEHVFPSRLQINPDASKYIEVDGVKYEVGEGQRDIRSKDTNLVNKLLTQYAILSNANREQVNIMLTLPASAYLNKEFRQRYREYIVGDGSILAKCNGDLKIATINRCNVYMEGAAAILPYLHQFMDSLVAVIDVGGNTVIGMIFDKGKILIESIVTFDTGMIKMERELIDGINVAKSCFMQPYELPHVIKNPWDDETKGVIDRIMSNHMEMVIQGLLEKKWNMKHLTLFITGGGADVMAPYFKAYSKHVVVSKEPIFDNVKGLWMVGKEVYKNG